MGWPSIIINEVPIVKRNHLHSQPVTSYGALSPITFTAQPVNLNIILTILSAVSAICFIINIIKVKYIPSQDVLLARRRWGGEGGAHISITDSPL